MGTCLAPTPPDMPPAAPTARALPCALRALRAVWAPALLAISCLLPLTAAQAEDVEPTLSLSANAGAGFMRGGHGGLMSGQRAPLALDIQVLTTKAPRFLIGGALRIELEDSKSVAGIPRLQLRHALGPLELRPGVGLPFYFAPKTMLGPEASLWAKLKLGKDFGLLVSLSAAAFMVGNDVPHGSTVIMFHAFLGFELFI